MTVLYSGTFQECIVDPKSSPAKTLQFYLSVRFLKMTLLRVFIFLQMFSGMFTHYVKPALTSQQAKELFGLLGYQPAGSSEEEELRLGSKPVHADTLLQLACAFFTARVECQLLLSNANSLGSCAEWELQLVLERKRGHTLQKSRESIKRKLESQILDSDMPVDVDLYTDNQQEPGDKAKTNHTTASLNSKDTPLSHRTSRSQKERKSGEAQTVCASKLSCQISSEHLSTQNTELRSKSLKPSGNVKQSTQTTDAQNHFGTRAEQQMGHCLKSHDLNSKCSCERCQKQGQNLKKHSCMDNSNADVFVVCHDCYNIHDIACVDIQKCHSLLHNLQGTGKLQPPQGEWGAPASPQRHSCLRVDDPLYVVCHTCNQSHDCLCEVVQQCEASAHAVKYLVEMKEDTHTPSKPMLLHQCCISVQPGYACITCKVFHTSSCIYECFRKHDVRKLKSVCLVCSDHEVGILCRFCSAQYCKKCWFEDPINCKCGRPFDNSSPV